MLAKINPGRSSELRGDRVPLTVIPVNMRPGYPSGPAAAGATLARMATTTGGDDEMDRSPWRTSVVPASRDLPDCASRPSARLPWRVAQRSRRTCGAAGGVEVRRRGANMRLAIRPTNSDVHELAEYAGTLVHGSAGVRLVVEPASSIAGVVRLQFAQTGLDLGETFPPAPEKACLAGVTPA
jgi:hypothetical protein